MEELQAYFGLLSKDVIGKVDVKYDFQILFSFVKEIF